MKFEITGFGLFNTTEIKAITQSGWLHLKDHDVTVASLETNHFLAILEKLNSKHINFVYLTAIGYVDDVGPHNFPQCGLIVNKDFVSVIKPWYTKAQSTITFHGRTPPTYIVDNEISQVQFLFEPIFSLVKRGSRLRARF